MKHPILFLVVAAIATAGMTTAVFITTGVWYVAVLLGGVPTLAICIDSFEKKRRVN